MTPVERAARALVGYESGGLCQPGVECTLCDCGLEGASPETLAEDLAQQLDRARFTITAALDEDELARVIEQQLARYTLPANYNTPLFEEHADVARRCAPFIARAVIRHLTGGSNE